MLTTYQEHGKVVLHIDGVISFLLCWLLFDDTNVIREIMFV